MSEREQRLHDVKERRAFLLQSLEDLEAERAAGDITDADYQLLRDDYTRRAAEVLREIDDVLADRPYASVRAVAAPQPGEDDSADTALPRWLKPAAIMATSVLVAAGLGLFVANQAGERSSSDGLTGSINAAAANSAEARARVLLQKGRDNLGGDQLVALQAFDEAAQLDPSLAEAFAYGGWILRIVSLSTQDPEQKRQLQVGALARLSGAVAANPRYPDAYAFRGIMQLRDLDDPKAALSDFVTLSGLNAPDQITAMVTAPRLEAERKVAALGGAGQVGAALDTSGNGSTVGTGDGSGGNSDGSGNGSTGNSDGGSAGDTDDDSDSHSDGDSDDD